ncbi:MAG TPA: type II 3-dehydroquinate dehydratase [Solirubrobacteraceae bacterium]|nr:type II 3-dehydroquinate dehydratase [Solirubrobacteraceae bacterium]
MSAPSDSHNRPAEPPGAGGRRTGARVDVLHGVNLDQLGRRDPAHYGALTLAQLEERIAGFAARLGLRPSFFQANAEQAYVERLHAARTAADGLVLNPGAWTHYAYAIRDALEIAGLPAVEVHLSAVDEREPFRRTSVIRDLCVATVSGEGPDGYATALARLREHL